MKSNRKSFNSFFEAAKRLLLRLTIGVIRPGWMPPLPAPERHEQGRSTVGHLLVVSMPRDLFPGSWEAFESAGPKVIERLRLFNNVQLPPSWSLQLGEGGMRFVVDEHGRDRASFYFDYQLGELRGGRMSLCTRYSFQSLPQFFYFKGSDASRMVVVDHDTRRALHRTEKCPRYDQACSAARLWLNQHFPQWQDPNAYR